MIDHIAIQVADVPASAAFYDRALAPLGAQRTKEFGEFISFGTTGHTLWLVPATDDGPAREVHLAFAAPDRAAVDAFHAAAVEAAPSPCTHHSCGLSTTSRTTGPSSVTSTATTSKRSVIRLTACAIESGARPPGESNGPLLWPHD